MPSQNKISQVQRYNDRNQASTDESNQDEIVEPDTNLEGFDSVRIHSLLEECIVTESNQSRLVWFGTGGGDQEYSRINLGSKSHTFGAIYLATDSESPIPSQT